MNPDNYFSRTALLDATQRVLGYRLSWQDAQAGTARPDRTTQPMLALMAQFPRQSGASLFFIEIQAATLNSNSLQHLNPATTVLMFSQAELACPEGIELAMSLHAHGFRLALCHPDVALFDSSDGLLSLMAFVTADLANPDLAQIARLAALAEPALKLIVNQVSDWNAFDACAALGLAGFFENMCASPRSLPRIAEMGSQTVLILQLMKMVQACADIRELEKVLQRDAMLSYKLLRYINSAGFGLQIEIESLRHAITMLGYLPLYRWLALLLATTSTAGSSQALLQAAIVRGRFVELLGVGLLPASEAGNLFVVGLFSLLDQLLGIPMPQLMRQVSLPDTIVQALLHRGDIYGPLLALAEACEGQSGSAPALADALFMTASQVNKAHGSAIVWAQDINL
ncbi:EAL and HDOD domain-containing protein [Polaromonas sp. CG_9.11]|uniref:EAL and HDOD domain-containing protein n=1 Tax=Polaromonas sp. CG_9.11 TaxID=2787730 RepID=UPI0018C94702|nr:HDOD domain-containing protein [Polaromonas sp. CG_9.11]MBG6077830.1 EAL and modified HD-GYP domain-containing signal transduction protein [Polaromonas sp. CG_9.11]